MQNFASLRPSEPCGPPPTVKLVNHAERNNKAPLRLCLGQSGAGLTHAQTPSLPPTHQQPQPVQHHQNGTALVTNHPHRQLDPNGERQHHQD